MAASRQQNKPLSLELTAELSVLPFELLKDWQFLDQRAYPATCIVRTLRQHERQWVYKVEARPLKVFFMACSPLDLKAHEVLRFERKEERILSSLAPIAVDLSIRMPLKVILNDRAALYGPAIYLGGI